MCNAKYTRHVSLNHAPCPDCSSVFRCVSSGDDSVTSSTYASVSAKMNPSDCSDSRTHTEIVAPLPSIANDSLRPRIAPMSNPVPCIPKYRCAPEPAFGPTSASGVP